jgi:anti-anti-sigma factor
MGRFELLALPNEGKLRGQEMPARSVPGNDPSRSPVAVQIEQTVIWAESRQISVSGELDLASVDSLQRLLVKNVGSGLPCIVLDLSPCEFLDAGALGVISGLQLQLASSGQELVVHGATGQVKRLIELAGAISSQICVSESKLPTAQRSPVDPPAQRRRGGPR